jgi:hypothetical protein
MRSIHAWSLAAAFALVGCGSDDSDTTTTLDQDASTVDTGSSGEDTSVAETNTTTDDTSVATDGASTGDAPATSDSRPAADAPVATDGAGDTPGKCEGVSCPMGKVCCQTSGDCVNAPKPPGC